MKTEGNDNWGRPNRNDLVCVAFIGSCPIWINVLAKSNGCVALVTPVKKFKIRYFSNKTVDIYYFIKNLWDFLPILNATWGQCCLNVSKSFNPEDQPTGQGFEIPPKFDILSLQRIFSYLGKFWILKKKISVFFVCLSKIMEEMNHFSSQSQWFCIDFSLFKETFCQDL